MESRWNTARPSAKCKLLRFLCTVILTSSWIIKHLLNCKSLAAFSGSLPTTLIANHSSTTKCPKPKIIQDSTNERFVMDFLTGQISNWLKYFPFWKKKLSGQTMNLWAKFNFPPWSLHPWSKLVTLWVFHTVFFERKDMVIKCGLELYVLIADPTFLVYQFKI